MRAHATVPALVHYRKSPTPTIMKLNNVMAFAALCVSNCVASDVSEMVNNKLKVESLQLKKESLQLEYQLKMNEIDHQMKEITGQNSTSTNVSVQKGIETSRARARGRTLHRLTHLSPLSLHLNPRSFAARTCREDFLHVCHRSPPHTLPSACSTPPLHRLTPRHVSCTSSLDHLQAVRLERTLSTSATAARRTRCRARPRLHRCTVSHLVAFPAPQPSIICRRYVSRGLSPRLPPQPAAHAAERVLDSTIGPTHTFRRFSCTSFLSRCSELSNSTISLHRRRDMALPEPNNYFPTLSLVVLGGSPLALFVELHGLFPTLCFPPLPLS